MKNNKQQSSFVNIGSSSLLIIFLILCLATFAILSISSAKSDYSFSERLAGRKTQYYDASAAASQILDNIDAKLAELAESDKSGGQTPYKDQVISSFHKTQIDDITLLCRSVNDEIIISYQVPTGDKQVLDVQLCVTDYTKSAAYYEIKSWHILSTEDWESDQKLNLMPMDN